MRATRGLGIALACTATAMSSAGVAEESLTPEDVAEVFCAARVAGDMEPVAEFVTMGLWAALASAFDQNEEWAAANPGEKPPLGDGVPWQSWPDRPSECVVEKVSYEMDESRVWIEYRFAEAPDAGFRDVLELRLTASERGTMDWRLDNVSYGTDGDLRTALLSAFMD